jgi:hypothetical protein
MRQLDQPVRDAGAIAHGERTVRRARLDSQRLHGHRQWRQPSPA